MEHSRISNEELAQRLADCQAQLVRANSHATVVDWMFQATQLLDECRRRLLLPPK